MAFRLRALGCLTDTSPCVAISQSARPRCTHTSVTSPQAAVVSPALTITAAPSTTASIILLRKPGRFANSTPRCKSIAALIITQASMPTHAVIVVHGDVSHHIVVLMLEATRSCLSPVLSCPTTEHSCITPASIAPHRWVTTHQIISSQVEVSFSYVVRLVLSHSSLGVLRLCLSSASGHLSAVGSRLSSCLLHRTLLVPIGVTGHLTSLLAVAVWSPPIVRSSTVLAP